MRLIDARESAHRRCERCGCNCSGRGLFCHV